jgi:cytochrome c556
VSDFEDFRASIARTFDSVVANGEATTRFAEETEREFARLWADNAELRDELHALANRVESLTRAQLTEPAEVAEAIASRSSWQACDVCGTAIRLGASDGLIYDREGLHTCRASA